MKTPKQFTTMEDQTNENLNNINNAENNQQTRLTQINSNADEYEDNCNIDNNDNDDSEDDDIDIIDRTTNAFNMSSNTNLFHFQSSLTSSLLNNLLNQYQIQQPNLNANNNNNSNLLFNLSRQPFNNRQQTVATNTDLVNNQTILDSANTVQTASSANPHSSMSSTEQFQLKESSQKLSTDASTSDQTSIPQISQQQSSSHEWLTSSNLIETRNNLRKKLTYHFMSPIDKWKIKGKFPWKLLFQIIKIILVTIQVILFGNNFASSRSIDNSMVRQNDIFILFLICYFLKLDNDIA